MTLWRPRREDIPALLGIALLPLFIALPQLLGLVHAIPWFYAGDLVQNLRPGWLAGHHYLDPNAGLTVQSLGGLVARDWLHGTIPWWNPYSGIGLPLAAEFQPAAFFPPTLLLALPSGVIWRHLLLQILAGWGFYAWLRQLRLGCLAAFAGGLLFAQNGTLSWFADAPIAPLAFFPWVLLGVEWAIAKAVRGEPAGWQPFAIALTLMLLAGFPETAYICGLFALAWAVVRATQYNPAQRHGIAARLLLGGGTALALTAPQLLTFAQFLSIAVIGGHADTFAYRTSTPLAGLSSLLAPYAYGTYRAYSPAGWTPLDIAWQGIGGYIDTAVLVLAAYGLWHRRDRQAWMLFAWIVLALAKVFGIQPLVAAWNLIPGVAASIFCRYSTPTWELASYTLAAFGIDALRQQTTPRRAPVLAAAAALVTAITVVLTFAIRLWPHEPGSGLHAWMLASLAWASVTGILLLALLACPPRRWRAPCLAALLVLDSTVMFAIPTLCDPLGGELDVPAITFLQNNLGLQRFYTLGPIAANYGAYFQIASINHDYLPVSARWANWVRANLDQDAYAINFTATHRRDPGQPSAAEQLQQHLPAYEEVGVKYVVTPAGQNPFTRTPPSFGQTSVSVSVTSGQSVSGIIPPGLLTGYSQINALSVLIGNYKNTASGTLSVSLCTAGQCASGSAGLTSSTDNAPLQVTLQQPISLTANTAVTYKILHQPGGHPVALWAFSTDAPQSLLTPAGPLPGSGLQLQPQGTTSAGNLPRQVYADSLMDIYQLPAPKPYFDATGCTLQPHSRTRVLANCATPTLLVRRELFFPGWQARIKSQPTPIQAQSGLFQSIALPAGQSTVAFTYAPPHIAWAWLLMLLGALMFVPPFFTRR